MIADANTRKMVEPREGTTSLAAGQISARFNCPIASVQQQHKFLPENGGYHAGFSRQAAAQPDESSISSSLPSECEEHGAEEELALCCLLSGSSSLEGG